MTDTTDITTTAAPALVPVVGGWIIASPARARGRFSTWAPDPSNPATMIKHFGTPAYLAAAHGVVTYTHIVSARRALRVVHRAMLEARHPEATITYGHRLSGPGPGMWGWWAVFPSGANRYLGRSLADAVGAGLDAFNQIDL